MNTIWFNDSEIGYAAGQDAITVKTTDGGITWNVLFTGEVVINALNFVDNTNGYAVANDGRFFQISPNWEMTQLHIDGELLVDNMHGFAMLDEKNGFIAIESGIITTVDAGKTFTRKPIPTGLVLGAWQKTPGAFVFDGSMKRFIFGKQQVMLTSRDFDNTSQLFSILPRGNDFYTTLGANLYLTFPNTLKGNVSKTLAYTIEINNLTNGLKILAPTHFEVSKDGVTFSSSLDYTKSDARGKQKLTLYARFRPTAFAPPSYDGKPASRAFHGYIIHKSLGAMTIKIPVKGKEGEYFAVAPNAIKEITEKPDFKLYPNPNKGEFRIKLENINRINGVLTIYDFTGRRVALPLINNSNEIEIDANYLPSGVYFVEYKTNDYKIVRKMVRN